MSWTSNPNPQTVRKFALTVHAYLRLYNEVTYTRPSPHNSPFRARNRSWKGLDPMPAGPRDKATGSESESPGGALAGVRKGG